MTDPLPPVGDGHTELTEDDRDGLLPSHIATRGELNEAEQENIARATLRRRKPTLTTLLDDRYLRDLHKAMFRDVWSWAGTYRPRETNLGVDPAVISIEVRKLVDDARTWVGSEVIGIDELAVRFHHRLVFIHPFRNGNGRHGRLSADYLVEALDGAAFSWGAHLDVGTTGLRAAYLDALRLADEGDIDALVGFARS